MGFIGSKSIKSACLPVVFGPFVTGDLLEALCASAGAEAIQRQRSYFVGKRGQRIGSELLTLRDDAQIDFGYKIENGKLAYPLRNTILGINVFDLLNNLDSISSDYREEPGRMMPTIRVRNVKVAGANQ